MQRRATVVVGLIDVGTAVNQLGGHSVLPGVTGHVERCVPQNICFIDLRGDWSEKQLVSPLWIILVIWFFCSAVKTSQTCSSLVCTCSGDLRDWLTSVNRNFSWLSHYYYSIHVNVKDSWAQKYEGQRNTKWCHMSHLTSTTSLSRYLITSKCPLMAAAWSGV